MSQMKMEEELSKQQESGEQRHRVKNAHERQEENSEGLLHRGGSLRNEEVFEQGK